MTSTLGGSPPKTLLCMPPAKPKRDSRRRSTSSMAPRASLTRSSWGSSLGRMCGGSSSRTTSQRRGEKTARTRPPPNEGTVPHVTQLPWRDWPYAVHPRQRGSAATSAGLLRRRPICHSDDHLPASPSLLQVANGRWHITQRICSVDHRL